MLAALQGGCSAPVGGYAAYTPETGVVQLRAPSSARRNGAIRAPAPATPKGPKALGRQIAADLLRAAQARTSRAMG